MVTSTPNSQIERLAKKYTIPLYINNGKSGICEDWNFGVQCTSTPYVTIAHQDDVYYKDYLKSFLNKVTKAKHPLIFFTSYYEIRNGKTITKDGLLRVKNFLLLPLRIPCLQKSRFVRRRILSLGCAICCPSVTYIRPNLPNPLFQSTMKCSLDWETWEHFSRLNGEFLYEAKPLMAHRIHQDSETSLILQENRRIPEDRTIFLRFWPKWIANIILKFYTLSEKSNNLSGKGN